MEEDLDDVETKVDRGVSQEPEVAERGLGEAALLLAAHGLSWTTEVLAAAGLDLDKDQHLTMAADQVDLPPVRGKLSRQDPVTAGAEEGGGGTFPEFAAGAGLNRGRAGSPVRRAKNFSDEGGKVRAAAAPPDARPCRTLCFLQTHIPGIPRRAAA